MGTRVARPCTLVPAARSGGAGWSACPAALRAVSAHLSKAMEPKNLKRDLGRLLPAASLLQKGNNVAGEIMTVAPVHGGGGGDMQGRSLHSSTCRLSLSRFVTETATRIPQALPSLS